MEVYYGNCRQWLQPFGKLRRKTLLKDYPPEPARKIQDFLGDLVHTVNLFIAHPYVLWYWGAASCHMRCDNQRDMISFLLKMHSHSFFKVPPKNLIISISNITLRALTRKVNQNAPLALLAPLALVEKLSEMHWNAPLASLAPLALVGKLSEMRHLPHLPHLST